MIRKFHNDDLAALLELWLAGNLDAHPFIDARYWYDHRQAVRQALAEADIFVYETAGAIKGFCGMSDSYLAGIFVDPASRSQGIGHALLEAVKAQYPTFTLHVYEKNQRAVAFYRREGLIVTARQIEAATGEVELTMAWGA